MLFCLRRSRQATVIGHHASRFLLTHILHRCHALLPAVAGRNSQGAPCLTLFHLNPVSFSVVLMPEEGRGFANKPTTTSTARCQVERGPATASLLGECHGRPFSRIHSGMLALQTPHELKERSSDRVRDKCAGPGLPLLL
eukprot:1162143-Pelagomonas_calceolata.AAC.5